MSETVQTALQPFVGPRPFEADDRDLFFGRQREAHEIRSLVLANKLFVLYAASGAGKTSLFNAGIRPLIEDELDILPTARFQPRVRRVARGVTNVFTNAVLTGWADRSGLGGLGQATLADFLAARPKRLAEPIEMPMPRLLVFDQFEELFTTHPDRWQQRRQFLEQLAEASDSDPDLRVLIVMREDYLSRLLAFADTLFSGLKDRYFLEPLRRPAAELAIAGPVRDAGRTLEPRAINDLVRRLMTTRVEIGAERIVQIEGEFVEPVLLQVVCQTLWAELPPDVTTITLAHVRELADVDKALGRFYSDAVREAASQGGATESQIRTWVGQKLLTHPGGTRAAVYAGARSTEGLPNEVVARLEGTLLRAEFRAGARWLEITHDSLLAPIERSNAEYLRSLEYPLSRLADNLAVATGQMWQKEFMLRRINDPYPLPVRWVAADPALADPWRELVRMARTGAGWPAGTAKWAASPSGLAGQGNELADVLARIPTGRLVVLGDPGSGKTVLIIGLVLELLRRRHDGDRVPVLLSAASWDPESQDLRSWLADQLIFDHPALAAAAGPGAADVSGAQALLAAGLILPILDGLDEIRPEVRGFAISRINDALLPGEGLVVTCRTAEYLAATRPASGMEVTLHAAAVIELAASSPQDVAAYLKLSAGGPVSAARWEPVAAALGTDTPLGQVLTSPLMVSLARAIYEPRPDELTEAVSDPAELLNQQYFPDQASIRDHLLDAFIAAAYRPSAGYGRARFLRAGDARRWLTFLARRPGLAWWELRQAAPAALVPLTVGVVCGIATGIATAAGVHSGVGIGIGLGVGLLVGLASGLPFRLWPAARSGGSGRPPRHDGPRPAGGIVGGLAGGIVGGLAAGLAGRMGIGHAAALFSGVPVALGVGLGAGACTSLMGGLVGGLLGGFAAGVLEGVGKGVSAGIIDGVVVALVAALAVMFAGRVTPAGRRIWSLKLGLAGGLVIGLASGLIVGYAAGVASGLVLGVALGIVSAWPAGLITLAAATGALPSPRAALARDVRAFWVAALAAGLAAAAFGFVAGGLTAVIEVGAKLNLPTLVADGLGIAIAAGLVVGLVFGTYHAASPSFLISRVWLSLRRDLPWRYLSFLADAHQRGVLRQNGAEYEFRHADLQHHLASADAAVESRHQIRPGSGVRRTDREDL